MHPIPSCPGPPPSHPISIENYLPTSAKTTHAGLNPDLQTPNAEIPLLPEKGGARGMGTQRTG